MANLKRIPNFNKGDPLHRRAEHLGKPSKPVNRKIMEVVRDSDPRIDVQIFRRKEQLAGQGEYYALFRLYSRVMPNYAVQAPLDLDRKSDRERDFEAGVVCGALAERLNEVYGDNFDADKCARHGSAQLQRVVDTWAANA